MGTFAGFFLLMLIVSDHMPPAASSIPLIGAYLVFSMMMGGLAILCSVPVCFVYDLPEEKPVSRCLKKACI